MKHSIGIIGIIGTSFFRVPLQPVRRTQHVRIVSYIHHIMHHTCPLMIGSDPATLPFPSIPYHHHPTPSSDPAWTPRLMSICHFGRVTCARDFPRRFGMRNRRECCRTRAQRLLVGGCLVIGDLINRWRCTFGSWQRYCSTVMIKSCNQNSRPSSSVQGS